MDQRTADQWAEMHDRADVALLSAPFTFPPVPSVALSIFRSILEEGGITARVVYPMFLMIHLMGPDDTRRLSFLARKHLYEEYCFAHLTDRPSGYTPEQAASFFYDGKEAEDAALLLEKGREAARIIVDAAARRIIAMEPKVAACSAIFSQLCASLAICRRIKELNPDIKTVLGGFLHGERGVRILRDYDSVDCVSFGEGDETILKVCRILMGLEDGPMPYGTLSKDDIPGLKEIPHRMTRDMNTVPMPVFDDYMEELGLLDEGFYQYDGSEGKYRPETRVYLEASRGCWWGHKHPCSFCGMNGPDSVFRSKDPDRIYNEIRTMGEKYPGVPIQLTDNILSIEFIKEVLPRMAADENDYRLFAEIKSNLKDSDIKALAKAGVRELQPGIESLNDHILKLLGKGNTGINHVNLLKQAERYGLELYWNILCGVPGEKEEDYLEMIDLMPKLFHFIYPRYSRIIFDRNSRYEREAEKYALDLIPERGSEMIYGDDPDTLSDMVFSYDAEGDFAETYRRHRHLYRQVGELAEEWQRLFESDDPPVMNCIRIGSSVLIKDTRPCARETMVSLDGIHADLYALMEAPVREKTLKEALVPEKYSEEEINEAIGELEEMSLIIHLSGRYLALAVPL